MALKYSVGQSVTLSVTLTFPTPPNLSSGSVGTINHLVPVLDGYYVKFGTRPDLVFVFDNQVQ
jgi:hypothetical protein